MGLTFKGENDPVPSEWLNGDVYFKGKKLEKVFEKVRFTPCKYIIGDEVTEWSMKIKREKKNDRAGNRKIEDPGKEGS